MCEHHSILMPVINKLIIIQQRKTRELILITPLQKIPIAKIRWKYSRLDFLGSRLHPPHCLSSKGPNYQRGVLLISASAIEEHFEEKTPREVHQGGLVLARQCPGLTGHLQPRRNWPTWASSLLNTYPNLRIWNRRTTTCSLD